MTAFMLLAGLLGLIATVALLTLLAGAALVVWLGRAREVRP